MNKGLAPDLGRILLRGTLGVVFVSHGLPKLFGGVGGMAGFLAQLGVPLAEAAAWGVTLLEIGGGAALLFGLFVPLTSVLLSVHMLAGILLVHGGNGWYVVGPGQGGAEFNVVLIAALLGLLFLGPGPSPFSDSALERWVAGLKNSVIRRWSIQ
jgi:putative oxidoreductase